MWFKPVIAMKNLCKIVFACQLIFVVTIDPAFSSNSQTTEIADCNKLWSRNWHLLKRNNSKAAAEIASLIALQGWIIPGMNDTEYDRKYFFHSLITIGLSSSLSNEQIEIYKNISRVYWRDEDLKLASDLRCFGVMYGSEACIDLAKRSKFFLSSENLISLIKKGERLGQKVACEEYHDQQLEKIE